MLAQKELTKRYLIRAAFYDSVNDSCIEIICLAQEQQELAKLLSEGLAMAMSGIFSNGAALKTIPIL